MTMILNNTRLKMAKRAFSTRRVPQVKLRAVSTIDLVPRAGDVVLAKVTRVGRLEKLELMTGRKAALYVGDEVIVAYGNRYAPDAYEAEVPANLGPCQLAAAGGIAGRILNVNAVFGASDEPTELEPIDIFIDAHDTRINLRDFGLRNVPMSARRAPVIAIAGASMNSGKTTTVAGIVRGLAQQGLKVGAAKVTGTAAGNDLWKFFDAGAVEGLDFTDVGMATSYLESIDDVVRGAHVLVHELNTRGADVIVLELADGVHQRETRALIESPAMRGLVSHWVFAADSAGSVVHGVNIMRSNGIEVRAVSGLVTASPLAMREAMHLVDAPFVPLPALESGAMPMSWLASTAREAAIA